MKKLYGKPEFCLQRFEAEAVLAASSPAGTLLDGWLEEEDTLVVQSIRDLWEQEQ